MLDVQGLDHNAYASQTETLPAEPACAALMIAPAVTPAPAPASVPTALYTGATVGRTRVDDTPRP
jgi:hypothetical protein